MKDKDKFIRYFEAAGYGELAIRMLDLSEQVLKGRPYRLSDFISPGALVVVDAIQAQYPQLRIVREGGYEGAERVRIAFIDRDFSGPVDMEIGALMISWDPRFRLLTHRDVMGALLNLGIDRDHFGDIIMCRGGAQVLLNRLMKEYVEENFTKIAMVGVSTKEIPLSEVLPKEEKVKEIRTTVASLRLDAVASSGFSMSRTKLVEAVNAGLLQVNWQPAKGPAQEVKSGDIISMRGRGRMKIEEITGTSRKGRVGVLLKRFI